MGGEGGVTKAETKKVRLRVRERVTVMERWGDGR